MFEEYQKMMSEVIKRACFSDCGVDMVEMGCF